jgi:hypothetical protein
MLPDSSARPFTGALVVAFVLLILSASAALRLWALPFFPTTPANDVAKHAALVVNFQDAITDGQWLPRMQPGVEHLRDLPDVPILRNGTRLLRAPGVVDWF